MVSSKYSPEIEKLLNSGAEAMAAKNYDFAVEYYSEACQLANLESDKDDPDLMYLYGKSLFENAASKNDVLGSKESNNKETSEKDSTNKNGTGNEKGNFQFNDKLAEDEEDDEDGEGDEAEGEVEKEVESSEEEVEEKNAEEQNEDEQTDFEIAWDILDLTRILYEEELKKLEADPIEVKKLNKKQPYLKSDKLDDFKSVSNNSIIVLIKKLSDVYDLLGEISLETENFKQATNDFKSMCELKSKLYPINTGSITEAYYKLSLAWEFCTDDLSNIINSIDAMKKSLESIQARKNVESDLIAEMEQRLYDLEKGDAKIKEEKEKIMKDILGEITSSSTTANKKDEPEKGNGIKTQPVSETPVSLPTTVNDLTQMVRKRKNKPERGRMIKKIKK